jgi:hypothetical protein
MPLYLLNSEYGGTPKMETRMEFGPGTEAVDTFELATSYNIALRNFREKKLALESLGAQVQQRISEGDDDIMSYISREHLIEHARS